MAKIISTIKAILTRIFFGAHSLIAIWQVTNNTGEIIYWTLCGPLALLVLEGIFTLVIKKTQEWRWFCPSVFLYLSSIVPSIWLLELDKVGRRLSGKSTNATKNIQLDNLIGKTGLGIEVPPITVDTWTTLIEQFLMLILIVGRWMLPKGDLTRDQLSQLLLVYIGTAADIIEFFDSYKDDSIAKIPLLVYLTLGIWSWSLLQFTIVLSATRARRPRGSSSSRQADDTTDCCNNCCCGIDVWGIVLNVILQDAPFLTFRLLIIFQYRIINYMNVFFTCKNSLVIILQLYRLYVVNAEFWKQRRQAKLEAKSKHFKSHRRVRDNDDADGIYVISSERPTEMRRKIKRAKDYDDEDVVYRKKAKTKDKTRKRKRKDTGYSTASSQNLYSTKVVNEKEGRRKDKKAKKAKRQRSSSDSEVLDTKKSKRGAPSKATDKHENKKKSRKIDAVIEESSSSSNSSDSSNSTLPSYEVINEKKSSKAKHRRGKRDSSSSTDSSDTSSSSSSEST